MKQFFKIVFASMIGAILSFFLLLIIGIFVIIGMISSASSEKPLVIEKNSVLHIKLDYPIDERTSNDPFKNFNFTGMESRSNLGLNDIIKNIKKAKEDENISGIYLDLSSIQSGFSTIEEIRNALIDFKQSKKFIVAYSEVYTQGAYYLASVADKIYLNPAGLMELRGFRAQIMFLKGTMEKLELEPQIIRVGTYKSAVEPLILDKMSDANREQTSAWIGSLYDHFLTKISESRHVNKDSLFHIADKLLIQDPEDGIKYKMIDKLMYKDEMLKELAALTNTEDPEKIKFVELKGYKKAVAKNISVSKNKIAVIYAVGDINSGEGNDESIGSERISKAIRKARLDKDIKAIVLRINSPGGSALASDVIWREVLLAKQVKPVVASMGDVAASGGYYIACAADTIIAQPNTITGSIGVFGVLLNAKKFLNNKLGITYDVVKTGEFADLGTMTRPLTEAEKSIIQKSVNKIYDEFTGKVAEGRHMHIDSVKKIAEGRVWSGADAQKIGLVDVLGDFNDAVLIASKMAKLSDYRVIDLPEQKEPFEKLLEDFAAETKMYITQQQLGDSYKYYEQITKTMKMQGIQAKLPFEVEVY